MSRASTLSGQTQRIWLVDALLFLSGVLAALSGVYFLFLPVGGYQGGRNPMYGVTILFSRHTWEDLHVWSGIAMIVVAAVHIALHWNWITSMSRRALKTLVGRPASLSGRSWMNAAVNAIVATSFAMTAISGLYFFLWPRTYGRGVTATAPTVLFSASAWDLIHTWASVALITAALVHFAIHWRWVTNVTKGMVRRLAQGAGGHPAAGLAPAGPAPCSDARR